MTPAKIFYFFSLYVAGTSPKSSLAISNLRKLCADDLRGVCKIKIVDLLKAPGEAQKRNIVVLPTLIKTKPLPEKRFIGSLTDAAHVLQGLGLA